MRIQYIADNGTICENREDAERLDRLWKRSEEIAKSAWVRNMEIEHLRRIIFGVLKTHDTEYDDET